MNICCSIINLILSHLSFERLSFLQSLSFSKLVHQHYDNRSDQEGGQDAEYDHEGQDVLVEAGGVALAHCILAAG